MSKKSQFAARIIFLSAIIFILGCNKIVDIGDLFHHNNGGADLCHIQKIVSTSSPSPTGDTVIAIFSYNQKGDPESVTFNSVGTGRPNLQFLYDKSGKLTDYALPYGNGDNGGFELWTHYQYLNGRIVSDSVYGFGGIINGIPQPDRRYVWAGQYEYDVFGRVIKHKQMFLPDPRVSPTTENYVYDANGNLSLYTLFFGETLESSEQFTSYDNKVNIHRTSQVWMFVDRNYSVNNPTKATSYNAKGLPLGFNATLLSFPFLYNFDLNKSVIQYKCR